MATDPKSVEYIVEATSFEHHMLWAEWHHRVKWEQIILGFWATVDVVTIKRKKWPITVNVSYAKIDRHVVAFYYSPSMVTNHDTVEEWVKKEFPHSKGHSDAMNFAHVFSTLGIPVHVEQCKSCHRY